MRVMARRRSSELMTLARGKKTPPYGGASDLSRSATCGSLSVRLGLSGPASRSGRDSTSLLSEQLRYLGRSLVYISDLGGADLRRDRTQHAVHEPARLRGRVPPRHP